MSVLSGNWRIAIVEVETSGKNAQKWSADISSLSNNVVRLLTTEEDLLWAYADTPNNFPMTPLTVKATSDKGETRDFAIIEVASGFTQKDQYWYSNRTAEAQDYYDIYLSGTLALAEYHYCPYSKRL